jgi:hypothetical protein
MAAYRKTEITVETDQIWIIRKSRSTRAWCMEEEVDSHGDQTGFSTSFPQKLNKGEPK